MNESYIVPITSLSVDDQTYNVLIDTQLSDMSAYYKGEPYLKIGNITLTQEEYETCMTYLLELTKKNRPEEFI